MKKLSVIIFFIFTNILVSFACWAQSELEQAREMVKKLKQREIVIAYTEYPPYEFATYEGEDGLTIRKVKTVAKDLGLKVRFDYIPWTRAVHMAKRGEVDGLLSLNQTIDREEFLNFPRVPLAKNEEVIFSLAKKQFPKITQHNQLRKYSIGLMPDYTYGKDFDAMENLKKVYGRDDINLIERLRKEWIDVILISKKVFYYQIKKLKLDPNDFVEHPLVLNSESLSLAFSRQVADHDVLKRAFEIGLKNYPYDFDKDIRVDLHCIPGTPRCRKVRE